MLRVSHGKKALAFEACKRRVEQTHAACTLLAQLRAPEMRDQHWEELTLRDGDLEPLRHRDSTITLGEACAGFSSLHHFPTSVLRRLYARARIVSFLRLCKQILALELHMRADRIEAVTLRAMKEAHGGVIATPDVAYAVG